MWLANAFGKARNTNVTNAIDLITSKEKLLPEVFPIEVFQITATDLFGIVVTRSSVIYFFSHSTDTSNMISRIKEKGVRLWNFIGYYSSISTIAVLAPIFVSLVSRVDSSLIRDIICVLGFVALKQTISMLFSFCLIDITKVRIVLSSSMTFSLASVSKANFCRSQHSKLKKKHLISLSDIWYTISILQGVFDWFVCSFGFEFPLEYQAFGHLPEQFSSDSNFICLISLLITTIALLSIMFYVRDAIKLRATEDDGKQESTSLKELSSLLLVLGCPFICFF